MILIKRLLILLVLLCGLVLGIWFSANNPEPLTVIVLGFPMPEFSSGVWLITALLLGAILGYLVSIFPALKLKNENMSLNRKLKRRDREIEKLRKLPVKSSRSGGSTKSSSLASMSE